MGFMRFMGFIGLFRSYFTLLVYDLRFTNDQLQFPCLKLT
jgi:hypothetical protein